jgi:hypothetical protein
LAPACPPTQWQLWIAKGMTAAVDRWAVAVTAYKLFVGDNLIQEADKDRLITAMQGPAPQQDVPSTMAEIVQERLAASPLPSDLQRVFFHWLVLDPSQRPMPSSRDLLPGAPPPQARPAPLPSASA